MEYRGNSDHQRTMTTREFLKLIGRRRWARGNGLIVQKASNVGSKICRRIVATRFLLLERLGNDGFNIAPKGAIY
jgi:hypothetical protein